MRLSGWLLASLLVLNGCAFAQPDAPLPGLNPVPADSVVMLASGAVPSYDGATVAVFAPSRTLERLVDTDLLKHYAPLAGQRGANHVSLLRVNGRRMVRAYYLRIPVPVTAVLGDSAKPQPPSGGSSAMPSTGGSVHVRGYYRRDGTYVRPHTRSRPGSRRRN